MQPDDPSFGAGFPADVFRDKIRSTMQMGIPNSVPMRPTFRWTTQQTFSQADPKGLPYDWGDTPVTSVEHDDVQIPVAVQLPGGLGSASRFGPEGEKNDEASAVVYILDVDYELVEGADQILLSGNTYHIDYYGPIVSLFTVDVHTAYCSALDES